MPSPTVPDGKPRSLRRNVEPTDRTGFFWQRGGRRDGQRWAQEFYEDRKQLYRVVDAMVVLSMSRSAIYEQIRSGRLRSVTRAVRG